MSDLDEAYKSVLEHIKQLKGKLLKKESPEIEVEKYFILHTFPGSITKLEIVSNKTEELYDFAEHQALKQKRESQNKKQEMLEEIYRIQQEIEEREKRVTFLFEEIKKVKHERR